MAWSARSWTRGWRERAAKLALRFLVPGTLLGSPGAPLLVGSSGAVHPTYPVENSMSALSRFPWVWVAVNAIVEDLAGLPIVAERKGRNRAERRAKRELVDDPILDLLENPNPGMDGVLFRKQLILDRVLTGNAYIYRPRGGADALYRLHPKWCSPIPGPFGIPAGYELRHGNGAVETLPASEVYHLRGVSWADDVQSLVGESSIRPLHEELMVELGHKKLAAEQAQKGHPDVIMSIDGQAGKGLLKRLLERWEASRLAKHSAFVVGKGVTVEKLSWTPEEVGSQEFREWTRDAVLSVFGVPPARAGLSSANYGTQKQQMRTYWERLIALARSIDVVLSRLAGPGVRLRHDFTDVEALQVSRTERLDRAVKMVQALGATPADAMAYEGFAEAPVPDEIPEGLKMPRPVDRPAEEPQGDKTLRGALARYLERARPRFVALGEQLQAGVDITLLQSCEEARLFAVLDRHHAPEQARWWAEQIVGETVEALRMGGAPFDAARAAQLAERIDAHREAA